jgi:hypothetical protein
MSETQQRGCPTIQRPSHNSQFQQKEAMIGLYIGKNASYFAKYLIMGQALHCGCGACAS